MAKAGASKQLVDYLQGHKLNYDAAILVANKGLQKAIVGMQ